MSLRDQPYLPLFIQDIMTDEKLNECSAATHGIYIKGIMCLMHKSEKYGKLLLKQNYKQTENQPKNFALQLIKHLPYTEFEIETAISELIKEKVCYFEGDYLCQKRMIRDNEKSLIKAEAGKKGGLKTQYDKAKKKASVKAKREANTEYEYVNKNVIEDLYKSVVIFFDEDCRPKTEKQKQDWCDTLDKLIRIDGHSPEHIQNIIKRTRMDDFWRTNFLSVLKLRKKNKEQIPYFTVFEKKINNDLTNGKQPGATVTQLADIVSRNFGSGQ